MARRLTGGAWLLSLALLVGLATILSCAHPMPPGGGPPDETPPWLTQAWPESAATGQGEVTELRFTFSEKMDRQDAFRWLRLYPRRTFRSTRWQGSQTAVVRLETPLPPDSVVVVELLPGMKDNHGVPQPAGRMWPFATGDTLPTGVIEGALVLENKPLIGGVVELLPDGPDTVRLQQRPVLRRARTDSTGTYRLAWLPKLGDGWLLRTYDDRNFDWRPGDNEAVRLWPDTLRLSPDVPRRNLGLRVLYQPTTPGTLEGELELRPAAPGPIFAFVQKIAEEDTGFVPRPQPPAGGPNQAVPDTGRFTLNEVGPGLVRAIFFVDRDGDSLLSAIPVPEDTLWTLEPWAVVDSVQVEPGLPTSMPAPVWPDTLTPWSAPVLPDTTAAAGSDSLATDPLGPSSAPPPGRAPADTATTGPPKE
jgi:hypothetical protein